VGWVVRGRDGGGNLSKGEDVGRRTREGFWPERGEVEEEEREEECMGGMGMFWERVHVYNDSKCMGNKYPNVLFYKRTSYC
jgi:hypothetical protein